MSVMTTMTRSMELHRPIARPRPASRLGLACVALLAACTPPATTPRGDEARNGRPLDHSALAEPAFSGVEVRSQYVETSDGTRIAVDVYLPQEGPAERFSTIFQYTPYHRSEVDPRTGDVHDLVSAGVAPYFTSHGYAMVVADMRGTGASSGWILDFMPEIWRDGKEVVDWIAAQPWSDGAVGMMGGSYVGWSQTATASQRPAALKAIAPSVIPLEGYTGEIYPGGIFVQGFIDRWAGIMYPSQRNQFHPDQGAFPTKPAVDEDGDGELADEIPLDVDDSGTFLDDPFPPVYADGASRSDHVYYQATKEHDEGNYDYANSTRDMTYIDRPLDLGYTAYDLGPAAHIEAIMEADLPVYHFGGWFDGFARGTFELYSTMRGKTPQKLAILPAYHNLTGGPFWEREGYSPEAVRDLFLGEHLRFFDRYLKGIDNGIDREPPLSLYVMNGGGFRFENEWPLAREVRTKYVFAAQGALVPASAADGEAATAADAPDAAADEADEKDEYAADFTHDSSYGTNGGNRWLGLAGNAPDALPWRTEKDPQCLLYETAPLAAAMEVTGHPLVNVALSSTASHGDLFVYLEDVDPEGRSLLVSEGQLRAGFAGLVDNDEIIASGAKGIDVEPELPWHGYEEAEYVDGILADGAVVDLTFDLLPTSWVFLEGHRIRVSLAAADHPTFRLHPRLAPLDDPGDPRNTTPTLSVHRDAVHRSWIDLPVIPAE